MKSYDLVVQLGSQVKYSPATGYELAPHTEMRTIASAFVIREGIAENLVISGGSNFGVRYNDREIKKPADFTFAALADANLLRKSEAEVIKDFLVYEYGVASGRIFTETLSSTTEENAEFLKILLRRRPAFTGKEKIGLLTHLYHMEKALPVFEKAGLNVEPLFVEKVLAWSDVSWINTICDYYGLPRGGRQHSVEKIREWLTMPESLKKLM